MIANESESLIRETSGQSLQKLRNAYLDDELMMQESRETPKKSINSMAIG